MKKYIAPLLRLVGGALSIPLLMSMSEASSVPFYTSIKFCYTKSLEWLSLFPGPEAKFSSSEITSLFTVSYQDMLSISTFWKSLYRMSSFYSWNDWLNPQRSHLGLEFPCRSVLNYKFKFLNRYWIFIFLYLWVSIDILSFK